MGRRGPKPLPSTDARIQGSWRQKKREKTGARSRELGEPVPPPHMGADQLVVWEQVAAQLRTSGAIAATPPQVLERYVVTLVRWRRLQAFIARHGDVMPIRDGNGQVKSMGEMPQSYIASRLGGELLKLEAELGLTPSSRTRVIVPPPQPDAESLEAFNSAGGIRLAT